uniref:Uncharacterized protein n=1 Tax=Rhizophora mucronata TaxID=61149 RepID=A0A2P2NT70_RHIMU
MFVFSFLNWLAFYFPFIVSFCSSLLLLWEWKFCAWVLRSVVVVSGSCWQFESRGT